MASINTDRAGIVNASAVVGELTALSRGGRHSDLMSIYDGKVYYLGMLTPIHAVEAFRLAFLRVLESKLRRESFAQRMQQIVIDRLLGLQG
jgi:hypothetical protein